MTNRERLMEQLSALDSASLEHAILSRRSNLPERLQDLNCRDCQAAHGGRCPSPEDDDICLSPLVRWLDQPNLNHDLIGRLNP